MGHEMSKEELLAMRIRQLKRRPYDMELALRLEVASSTTRPDSTRDTNCTRRISKKVVG